MHWLSKKAMVEQNWKKVWPSYWAHTVMFHNILQNNLLKPVTGLFSHLVARIKNRLWKQNCQKQHEGLEVDFSAGELLLFTLPYNQRRVDAATSHQFCLDRNQAL